MSTRILKPRYLVLHGPNLNLLGTREPDVYGRETLADIGKSLESLAQELGCEVSWEQHNSEGSLVESVHRGAEWSGIILNPGAYTHTSLALRDAIAAVPTPVIEVHLSHVARREEFRHVSLIAGVCVGTIAGFGSEGYRLALRAFWNRIQDSKNRETS